MADAKKSLLRVNCDGIVTPRAGNLTIPAWVFFRLVQAARPSTPATRLATLWSPRTEPAPAALLDSARAVLFAVKAARAFTGRSKIAKIEGAYHGAYDWVEVSQAATPENWGDASAPTSTPFYRGMPKTLIDEVVVLRFNDAEGARRLL